MAPLRFEEGLFGWGISDLRHTKDRKALFACVFEVTVKGRFFQILQNAGGLAGFSRCQTRIFTQNGRRATGLSNENHLRVPKLSEWRKRRLNEIISFVRFGNSRGGD